MIILRIFETVWNLWKPLNQVKTSLSKKKKKVKTSFATYVESAGNKSGFRLSLDVLICWNLDLWDVCYKY